jgi:hypothetical protein
MNRRQGIRLLLAIHATVTRRTARNRPMKTAFGPCF